MTTAKTPKSQSRFRLPDPPDRHPDDMTSFKHLAATGNAHYLALHCGNPETTLVTGERYVVVRPSRSMAGSHYPDLLVAFGVDPSAYEASNGYIIAEQGKPPDFVLEIASPHTGHIDVGAKRDAYAALGILEYWRFDETGQYHGTRLAGDRLADGLYVPVPIDEPEAGVLQGHSVVLNLRLRWDQGELAWHDPATGRSILTYDDQRARADREVESRRQAEARADHEVQSRLQAEARVLELEAEIRRLRNPAT